MASAFTLRMSIGLEPVDGPAITNRTILRRELEASIERLIAQLDDFDGDPDDEHEGNDEPSLGWSEDDRFITDPINDDDLEEDDDLEPSIGFTERSSQGLALALEPRFRAFRRYRHERDYDGVSTGAEGSEA